MNGTTEEKKEEKKRWMKQNAKMAKRKEKTESKEVGKTYSMDSPCSAVNKRDVMSHGKDVSIGN